MPRPKKYGPGRLVISFSMSPFSSADVQGRIISLIDGMDELAVMEGKCRSEIVVKAMAEYLTQHYPGNPQVTLYSVSDNPPTELPMKVQWSLSQSKKTLSSLLHSLEEGKGDKGWILKRLESAMSRAAGAYDKTKDPELLKLIDRCKAIKD